MTGTAKMLSKCNLLLIIHLLLDMHPNIMPSRFINSLKTVSSRLIRKELSSHLKKSLSRNVLIAKYSFVVILIYLTRLKLEWHIAHAATLVLWPPLQQFDNHLQRHSQLYQFLGEPLLQDTA